MDIYEKFDYEHWCDYGDLSLFPLVTPEVGLAIYSEMERCEPFQHTKSMYEEDFKRAAFIKAVYHEALRRYPIAMERARMMYFKDLR